METALKFVALLVEAGIIQSMADFFVTLGQTWAGQGMDLADVVRRLQAGVDGAASDAAAAKIEERWRD